jgi:metal-responsive CopG/Arc/MetJ family transcriptional regulator
VRFGIEFGITFGHNNFMKTAISIPDEIFREIERFSKEHRYSRSEVFVMAVKEFLEKLKSRELFNALNEVYSEPESLEETTLREKSKAYYSKKNIERRAVNISKLKRSRHLINQMRRKAILKMTTDEILALTRR